MIMTPNFKGILIIIIRVYVLIFLQACTTENNQKEEMKLTTPISEEKPLAEKQKYVLSTENSKECLNYLNGRNFYGRNARLEFHNDGNAYAYRNADNEIVFVL